jgi:glycogen debranching enzyme
VTEPWAVAQPPPSLGAAGALTTLVEGSSFCISAASGDIRPGGPSGLFLRDTRVLSEWVLDVDGSGLEPLLVTSDEPFRATFLTRARPRPGQGDSTLLVVRDRHVGDGLLEVIRVRNLGRETAGLSLTLHASTDFADLFEVKEGRAISGAEVVTEVQKSHLEMTCASPHHTWNVRVAVTRSSPDWSGRAAQVGPQLVPGRITWYVAIPPRVEWSCEVLVDGSIDGRALLPGDRAVELDRGAAARRRATEWRERSPVVHTRDSGLAHTLARSREDLGALRIFDPDHPDRAVVAAGAPWFMALFGRDSLLTSWMVLPLDRRLALGTLQALAEDQGRVVDPITEEQPGRILHEVRLGRRAQPVRDGSHVYYGSVDATPLFVMLLGELRRWGLEREQVDALLPAADRALEWIVRYGDRDGDGFVEYERSTDRGLRNQGWKDSFDGVTFADGALAEPPIALCEVQAYVYAAYLARAHFAGEVGDEESLDLWSGRAEALKRAFNERFWLPDHGWFALGLDKDKRPIDALASNMGHCLWTGLVDEDKADDVARHLLSADMFSGWGVRTLARSMGAYNPMSYHNGSVWPHDNAILAAGLARYGYVAEAQAVARGVLEAAGHFGGRLPELFCGFDREEFHRPVPYPTSCSPQAWAAAAPVHLLRTLLRFDPWVPHGEIRMAPVLPAEYLPMRLDNVEIAGGRAAIDVDSDGFRVHGLDVAVRVVPEPRQPSTSLRPRHRR